MSIDLIGSFYTNNIEGHALKNVIVSVGTTTLGAGTFTAAYPGLFGAGSLITNITSLATPTQVTALNGNLQISANGLTVGLGQPICTFLAGAPNTIASWGTQAGVTLPQDSWLVATATGGGTTPISLPDLCVTYLS